MQFAEPLALTYSWPLTERDTWLTFEQVPPTKQPGLVTAKPSLQGRWHCDLSSGALQWDDAVHDLFGVPRGAPITRRQALAIYRDESRSAMERLRAHAIRHRRGFTIDLELHPATGGTRWIRLIAAPECENGHVIGLHGIKHDVSELYQQRQVA